MPKTKKLTPDAEVQDLYSLTVKMGGQKFAEVSAPTIPEALEKIKMDKFVGLIALDVKHGERQYSFPFLKPLFFRKVLEFPNHKLLFEKRAKLFLGEINL